VPRLVAFSVHVPTALAALTAFTLPGCANGRVDSTGRAFVDAARADAALLTRDAGPTAPDAAASADAWTSPSAEGVCGDGVCERARETCGSCPADCGGCPLRCGDGACDPSENASSCATDCSAAAVCGDGACDATESCGTCSRDCGACAVCGDGACGASESCGTCSRDCGACGSSDPCSVHTSCGACVDDGGCGFCDGVCVSGTLTGASGRACGSWTWWSWAC